ncbi:MAG: hypothetical protein NT061_03430 [Spirochaetes bacterium]|nr:hypothetical protein [Spirochaetota bacterium]
MKRTWSSIVLLSACVLLLFASCASGPKVVQVSKEEKELQKKVEAVNKAGGVAVIGTGIDETGRQDLALKKATLDGRAQIAQVFETKMQVLEKNFVDEVGSTAKAEINTMFSSTTKAISKTTLSGSQNLSLPVTFKEGNKITVKVVVGIDPKTLNSAVMSELKNNGPNLYERFRASQGFKEMQKEMEDYDKAGS